MLDSFFSGLRQSKAGGIGEMDSRRARPGHHAGPIAQRDLGTQRARRLTPKVVYASYDVQELAAFFKHLGNSLSKYRRLLPVIRRLPRSLTTLTSFGMPSPLRVNAS